MICRYVKTFTMILLFVLYALFSGECALFYSNTYTRRGIIFVSVSECERLVSFDIARPESLLCEPTYRQ